MKRYNISSLKSTILESSATRSNILTMLESTIPEKPYVIGYWKGYRITLPDGIELATKSGMKMAGRGLPVKVFNNNGQYSAIEDNRDRKIDLTYVLNEADSLTDIVVFD